jgi:hypothetical protein
MINIVIVSGWVHFSHNGWTWKVKIRWHFAVTEVLSVLLPVLPIRDYFGYILFHRAILLSLRRSKVDFYVRLKQPLPNAKLNYLPLL